MSLSAPTIHRAAADAESITDERCHLLESWNRAEDPAVSIARARVEPGVTTRLHRIHGISERYFILSGEGRVEVGGLAPTVVGPGEVVYIPPAVPQRIANIGPTDLVFLAVCTPRFVAEAYEDIDPAP